MTLSINIWATAKGAVDGCETTVQPTEAWPNGPLTDELQCYEAKVDDFLTYVISIRDVVVSQQSEDENGIHGMQAFHMACKE